jgi:hypothetical protein
MNRLEEIVRRSAWRSTMVAGLLNGVGTPLDIVIGRAVPHMPWWPDVSASAIGWAIGFGLLARRKAPPSMRVCSILFVLNTTAITVALWVTGAQYAASGIMPFQANKLGVIAAAILAPEAWAGLVSIGLYTASAVVQLMTLAPALRGGFALEPGAMLVFGAFSILLLTDRLRRTASERRLLVARAEADAALKLADLSLRVRDLSNTPLQTIMLETALIRDEDASLAPRLDRIDRALQRLTALNRELDDYAERAQQP